MRRFRLKAIWLNPPEDGNLADVIGIITPMPDDFRFFVDIPIRYGDLDPQWHVNNARYLTFMEQARLSYLIHLGLWDGVDFMNLGLIVADVHIAYLAPLSLGQTARVFMRVSRLGNKSMLCEYQVADAGDNQIYAKGETVMVAYDYHTRQSIPIPVGWREKIADFEGIPTSENRLPTNNSQS
jgi:acyl-CoA thioester hydrolase